MHDTGNMAVTSAPQSHATTACMGQNPKGSHLCVVLKLTGCDRVHCAILFNSNFDDLSKFAFKNITIFVNALKSIHICPSCTLRPTMFTS